jgi:Recombinase
MQQSSRANVIRGALYGLSGERLGRFDRRVSTRDTYEPHAMGCRGNPLWRGRRAFPGPPHEVATVRWIFKTFVEDGKTEPELARMLNGCGLRTIKGGAWAPHAIRRILCNERYIGNYVWNRISTRLRSAAARNAPDKWVRAEGAIAAIVPRPVFDAAQHIMRRRKRKVTADEKLDPLRRLLRKHGRLTGAIIRRARDTPSVSSYRVWFGGLIPAYRLVGFTGYRPHTRQTRPPRNKSSVTARLSDDQLLALLRAVLIRHGFLNRRVIDAAEGVPNASTYAKRFGSARRAYRLAGFLGEPDDGECGYVREARRAATFVRSNKHLLKALRRILRKHGRLTRKIIDASGESASSTTCVGRFGSIGRA